MDWETAEVEHYGVFPWPWNVLILAAFLVGAVFVARRLSGSWLFAYWLAAAATWGAVALYDRWPLYWGPMVQVAGITLFAAIPSGLACLGLALLLRRQPNAKPAWLLSIAMFLFLGGLVLAGVVSTTMYRTLYPNPGGEPVAAPDAPRR